MVSTARHIQTSTLLSLAAGLLALSIVLGAFAAHGLKNLLSGAAWSAFNTGVQYHAFNTLGLFVLAALMAALPAWRSWLDRPFWVILAGIGLFSGSLYVLALTGWEPVAYITPVGGLALIAGWCLAAFRFWQLAKVQET